MYVDACVLESKVGAVDGKEVPESQDSRSLSLLTQT